MTVAQCTCGGTAPGYPQHESVTTPCIEWDGYRKPSGYGQVGRNTPAHRAAYEKAFGAIPAGMFVCHRCDNPPCVNPEHLFLGTVQDNNRDRDRKGRTQHLRGIEASKARLTGDQVAEIRRRYVRGLNRWERGNGAELAEEFGIAQGYLLQICAQTRRQWDGQVAS